MATLSASQKKQLDSIKSSLLKMQSNLQSGKVTGLTPSPTPTTTATKMTSKGSSGGASTPTNANDVNTNYAAALAAAGKTASATPTTSAGGSYTVQSGDTLSQIAARNNTSTQSLLQLNPQYAQNPNLILPGQTIKLNTNAAIPSSAITTPQTYNDVQMWRDQVDQLNMTAMGLQAQLDEMRGFVDTPFDVVDGKVSNADQLITDYVTGRTPVGEAQREYESIYRKMDKTTDNFYDNREKNITKAYNEFGVEEKNDNLTRVQKEMAEREIRMREDLKAMETSPEFRGVSRQFANDQQTAIRDQATFELANLAILESAYSGDLERAEKLAQRVIDGQFDAYKGQIERYKMQLQALEPQMNAEQKQQALQLQLALDTAQQNADDKKADKKLVQEYAIYAAEAGASPEIYKSIMAARTADEAFMLAAPYMKSTKGTTSTTGHNTVAGAVGQSTVSPWGPQLTGMDFMKAKTADIKAAVNQQFGAQFSSYLVSTLTEEQLKDFLTKYEAAMQNPTLAGAPEGSGPMSIRPEQFLQYYLENYLQKKPTSSSSGGDMNARIDSLFE